MPRKTRNPRHMRMTRRERATLRTIRALDVAGVSFHDVPTMIPARTGKTWRIERQWDWEA